MTPFLAVQPSRALLLTSSQLGPQPCRADGPGEGQSDSGPALPGSHISWGHQASATCDRKVSGQAAHIECGPRAPRACPPTLLPLPPVGQMRALEFEPGCSVLTGRHPPSAFVASPETF